MTRKELFRYVLDYFQRTMPEAGTELEYHNPFHLIVAVILSAQCTDKRVNLITPSFFKHFPTSEVLAKSSIQEIFELIKNTGYYKFYINNREIHVFPRKRLHDRIIDEYIVKK